MPHSQLSQRQHLERHHPCLAGQPDEFSTAVRARLMRRVRLRNVMKCAVSITLACSYLSNNVLSGTLSLSLSSLTSLLYLCARGCVCAQMRTADDPPHAREGVWSPIASEAPSPRRWAAWQACSICASVTESYSAAAQTDVCPTHARPLHAAVLLEVDSAASTPSHLTTTPPATASCPHALACRRPARRSR